MSLFYRGITVPLGISLFKCKFSTLMKRPHVSHMPVTYLAAAFFNCIGVLWKLLHMKSCYLLPNVGPVTQRMQEYILRWERNRLLCVAFPGYTTEIRIGSLRARPGSSAKHREYFSLPFQNEEICLGISTRESSQIFFIHTDGCISRDRLSTLFQGAQGQWLCLILFWPGKDKPSLCINSKNTIWTASGILGHLEAAEHWMLRKDLSKREKGWDWTLHHPSNESTQWECLKRGNVRKEKSQKEQLYFFRVSPESKSIFVHGRKRNATS